MGQESALMTVPYDEEAEFEAFRPRVRGTNIDEQTLLATDYLNHFNEVVMLFDMIPDMPELIEDCKAWQPRSYEDHFRQSTFSDRELAVEAYGKVPVRFRVPFEETIRQINELILSSTQRLESAINAGTDPEILRYIGSSVSRAAQVLMDHASAIIHGSSQTMDQDEIDTMIGKLVDPPAMNIDLARTFLEVVETGNFNKAAERLSITQSTVSMRIKALEDEIGRPLFVRSKSGTGLTAAGIRFRRYATMMVRIWEQARQEIALPPGLSAVLTVGGHFALWDRLLVQWIPWMRSALPEVAVHAEVGPSTGLMRDLAEGLLDVGVMYAPSPRPGLVFEKLLEERLIMISTVKRSIDEWDPDYVYVDWGTDFKLMHSQSFPDQKAPAISVGLGALGLQHILAYGGTGYFPMRVIRGYLAAGRLHQVTGAPDFRHPAWVVYAQDEDREDWFMTALDGLRYVASLESED